MKYTKEEVIQFVEEDDVKFIRIAFCDSSGASKNISVMPTTLKQVFEDGIQIEACALDKSYSKDAFLYLFPDPSTLSLLPWRPDHGKVARMYSKVTEEGGNISPFDKRSALWALIKNDEDYEVTTEAEFVLFSTDVGGAKTNTPYDNAGYLDIAPLDKCENIRRSICLTLESMGILVKASCHSYNHGQNKIVYSSNGCLSSSDNLATFHTVVATMASSYGLYADNFSYRLLLDKKGIGLAFDKFQNPYESHIKLLERVRG